MYKATVMLNILTYWNGLNASRWVTLSENKSNFPLKISLIWLSITSRKLDHPSFKKCFLQVRFVLSYPEIFLIVLYSSKSMRIEHILSHIHGFTLVFKKRWKNEFRKWVEKSKMLNNSGRSPICTFRFFLKYLP